MSTEKAKAVDQETFDKMIAEQIERSHKEFAEHEAKIQTALKEGKGDEARTLIQSHPVSLLKAAEGAIHSGHLGLSLAMMTAAMEMVSAEVERHKKTEEAAEDEKVVGELLSTDLGGNEVEHPEA